MSGGTVLGALDWLVTAGVDVLVTDTPRQWLAAPPVRLAPAAPSATPPAPRVAATARPAASGPAPEPDLSGITDLPALHEALAAFAHPLCRANVAPQLMTGATASGTLIIADQPDGPDSDAARLATRMLAAIGLTPDNHARGHLLPWGTGRPPRDADVAAFAPFLARAVDLAAPARILALGDRAAALAGVAEPLNRLRGQWLDFRGRRLLATFHPRFLLGHAELKALAWADLQTFAESF